MVNVIKKCAVIVLGFGIALFTCMAQATDSLSQNDNELIIWEQAGDAGVQGEKNNVIVYVSNNQQGLTMLLKLSSASDGLLNNQDTEGYEIVDWVIMKQPDFDRVQNSNETLYGI